jgi:hypothetical protein
VKTFANDGRRNNHEMCIGYEGIHAGRIAALVSRSSC